MNPQEEARYARTLMSSIDCGLSKMEEGSTVELHYLNEKITKLKSWIDSQLEL